MENNKLTALNQHLQLEGEELLTEDNLTSHDGSHFEEGSSEYLVLTDDEANDKWEEALDNYLEECVYPELSDPLKNYFDDEAWKRDARMDGRGHSLSSYDGCEHEEVVGGGTFYIYQTN
tara:strand:+ start:126 stop:482 length:357 start_codon:yes stop_codon:yes gene_type:complete